MQWLAPTRDADLIQRAPPSLSHRQTRALKQNNIYIYNRTAMVCSSVRLLACRFVCCLFTSKRRPCASHCVPWVEPPAGSTSARGIQRSLQNTLRKDRFTLLFLDFIAAVSTRLCIATARAILPYRPGVFLVLFPIHVIQATRQPTLGFKCLEGPISSLRSSPTFV